MIQSFIDAQSITISPQQAFDEVKCLSALSTPTFATKTQFASKDRLPNLGIVAAIEGWVTTQKNVCADANAPHVT